MHTQYKINSIIKKNNSLLCVGLDSDVTKLPAHIKKNSNSQFEFNRAIIDATHNLVCAYKPNTAFYEAQGDEGIRQLKMTCDYLRENHPEVFLILDAKRADIGSTNGGYVQFAFDWLGADAITLHPYLGYEALKPFLDRHDKISIILCKTSNQGSGEFQNLTVGNKKLFQVVAEQVSSVWNIHNNCMLVTGATYLEELSQIRTVAPQMTFLVPGIGAQGGDLEKTLRAGLNPQKSGVIISASRSVIFASREQNFAEKAREEAKKLTEEINKYRI